MFSLKYCLFLKLYQQSRKQHKIKATAFAALTCCVTPSLCSIKAIFSENVIIEKRAEESRLCCKGLFKRDDCLNKLEEESSSSSFSSSEIENVGAIEQRESFCCFSLF